MMRPIGLRFRSLRMSIEFPNRLFRVQSTDLCALDNHNQLKSRIEEMASSLVEMFGASALSVADGQAGQRDVGGNSGIFWGDISRVLRSQSGERAACSVRHQKR